MPGTSVQQIGQRGAQNLALQSAGGDSDDNEVLPRRREGHRPWRPLRLRQSLQYGSRAGRGFIAAQTLTSTARMLKAELSNLTTPSWHHPAFRPSSCRADGGSFMTSRQEGSIAGAHKQARLPRHLQLVSDREQTCLTINITLPRAAANLGWQFERLHSDSQHHSLRREFSWIAQLPGDFYHVADKRHAKRNQDIYLSGAIDKPDHCFLPQRRPLRSHPASANSIRCGKHPGSFVTDYDGLRRQRDIRQSPSTITGCQRLLPSRARQCSIYVGSCFCRPVHKRDLPLPLRTRLQSRSTLVYQGDYTVTPHLFALIGFHFEGRARPSEVIPLPSPSMNLQTAPTTTMSQPCTATSRAASSTRWAAASSTILFFGVETTPRARFYTLRFAPRARPVSSAARRIPLQLWRRGP